jgi:GH15 family glucan-1,4-alpha-glucosidase
MRMDLVIRPDYGSAVPWVRRTDDSLLAVAGPHALRLHADVETRGEDLRTVAEFAVREGERITFRLDAFPSHETPPEPPHPLEALQTTEAWWTRWVATCEYQGPWREAVIRSLITLKALIYRPTGGMIAALTTSLPERIGGERNWDYRYCWIRDATFTLFALLDAGFTEEAAAWRDWLMRAVAGTPSQVQPVYGVAGERRLVEREIPWLAGFAGSRPVRIGNDAHTQLQLDVFGELMDTLHLARARGLHPDEHVWNIQRALMDHLASIWRRPDEGIWEVRSDRRPFTHSKVMAWVAFDRAVRAVEGLGLEGPVARWRRLRDEIHADVCRHGYDEALGSFTQSYGSKALDASLLLLPLLGFLPVHDPRIQGTVAAIERTLMHEGLLRRYAADEGLDGLTDGEGTFLMCSFWLADVRGLLGRKAEAIELFERLLALRNDVGLLSEEYDPVGRRLLGNFPQAFSHVALINTARNLSAETGPSATRAAR